MTWQTIVYPISFILTGTKYLTGVALFYTIKLSGVQFFFSVLSAGLLGSFLFVYISKWMIVRRERIKMEKYGISLASRKKEKREKKLFTKRNRRFVKFSRTYGIIGITIITPILLTYPLGSYLAIRFFGVGKEKKVLLFLALSTLWWTSLFTSIKMAGFDEFITKIIGK